jgi:gentisate 1,2-dioxygenase
MNTFQDVECTLVDSSGRQTPETKAWGDHNLPMWDPVCVPKRRIEAEIERLASLAKPANGVRRTHFVHPRCTDGSKAFSPGVDVSLNVLLPGERTAPVRQNSNVVDFCIRGGGAVLANGKINRFKQYDTVTTPSMAVHEYVNDTNEVQVRLRYSNGALLEKLNIHYVDEEPPVYGRRGDDLTKPASEIRTDHRNPFGTFQLTKEGAWLTTYEQLVNPESVSFEPKLWPWVDVKRELDKLAALGANYKGRRLYMLWDPATGRANGCNPSFFSTITVRPAGITDRPHRHASAAMNYFFGGRGHSIVQGKHYEWEAGDFMLTAPGWAVHSHTADEGPVYEMTIQDYAFGINTNALLWQEDMAGPISLLGSHAGFETNRQLVSAR